MNLALLGLALLVDGHHPLPRQPKAVDCAQAAPDLHRILSASRRPQRQRALALLWRCGEPLPLAILRHDKDPELRLSAWRLTLRRVPLGDRRWQQALRGLPPAQRRSILAWRERLRATNSMNDRMLP